MENVCIALLGLKHVSTTTALSLRWVLDAKPWASRRFDWRRGARPTHRVRHIPWDGIQVGFALDLLQGSSLDTPKLP